MDQTQQMQAKIDSTLDGIVSAFASNDSTDKIVRSMVEGTRRTIAAISADPDATGSQIALSLVARDVQDRLRTLMALAEGRKLGIL